MKHSDEGVRVIVRFPKEIGPDAQGASLMALEKILRASTGLDVRVTKDILGDDSKLRSTMTIAQREKL